MIKITISYNDVETAVRQATEYEGAKNGAFNALRALREDSAQLKHWYNEGVSIVCVLLDRLITKKVQPNAVSGDYEITLDVSNDNAPLISDTISHVVISHVLYKWLRLMVPDKSAYYKNDEGEQMESLKRMCYYREMPK